MATLHPGGGDSLVRAKQSNTEVLEFTNGMTLAEKVRHGVAASKLNPWNQPPICPAPTWQATTLYAGGAVVRGAGGDAGNLYICAGSTTVANGVGTSGSTGPTGTGYGLQADGAVVWQYFGPATSAGTYPMISNATLTGPTSVMAGMVQWISTSLAGTIGLSSFRPSTAGTFATEAYFTGGVFGLRIAERIAGPNTGTAAAPAYASAQEQQTMEFKTNATKWIGLRGNGPRYAGYYRYEVEINGRRLSESMLTTTADDSTNTVMLIDLSKFPIGEKTIRVSWQDSAQRLAFEIYKAAGDAVWPVENPYRYRLALEGDSITDGSYFAGQVATHWLEKLVADKLGCDAFYNNAQGGTGVISTSNGTKTTYLQRLPGVVSFAPDILFVGGMHNDNMSSRESRTAAMLEYLRAVRAALPKCKIFLIGAFVMKGDVITAGASTSMYEVEVDAKTAFDAFADDNSHFIPLLTAPGSAKMVNTGDMFFPNLAGGAYATDAHPGPIWYHYISGWIAEKMKTVF